LISQEGTISREKERESRHSAERFEPKRKPVSRQPLPGFHQAFGSTEIGRFSRSEFFVNMVGESGDKSGDVSDGGNDVSREHRGALKTTGNSATAAAAAATAAAAAAAAATAAATALTVTTATVTAAAATVAATGGILDASRGDNRGAFVVGNGAPSYCGQPRWHCPHVGAIGSEI